MTLDESGIVLKNRVKGEINTYCSDCDTCRKNGTNVSVNLDKGVFVCHKTSCPKGWNDGGKLDEEKYNFKKPKEEPQTYKVPRINITDLSNSTVDWFFSKRGLKQDVLRSMNISETKTFMPGGKWEGREIKPGQHRAIVFPYYRDKELINCKYRTAFKSFRMEQGAELIFYNIDSVKDKDWVIVTEGEVDALSFIQAGYDSVISVPNGGKNSGDKYFSSIEPYLSKIKEVYLAVDNDTTGLELRDNLTRRFGKAKCKIVRFPDGCKDANDVLVKHNEATLKQCIEEAEFLPISGVVRLNDIRDRMWEEYEHGLTKGESTHFGGLDNHFLWQKGYLYCFSGYGNYGKSAFIYQLMLIKSIFNGDKWAIYGPENVPDTRFYRELCETYSGKSGIKRFGEPMSKQEYKDAMDFVHSHFVYVEPDMSKSPTLKHINSIFEPLIVREGVSGCLIDPWNTLDHMFVDGKKVIRDDQYLSAMLADEKAFAKSFDIHKMIIAHPNKPKRNDKTGEVPRPKAFDISGGAMWNNKCDVVAIYHRPNFEKDRSDTLCEFHIDKYKDQTFVTPDCFQFDYQRRTRRFLIGGRSPIEKVNGKPDLPSSGLNTPGYLPYSDNDDDLFNDDKEAPF